MPEELSGFGTGWYVISFAEEITKGQVVPLRYFGKSLVAFRGDSGDVHVLDAHCPHLGADLGIGGTVVGDTVRCPFHAWRFAGDGSCAEIPYNKSDKIPPRAKLRSWDVRERNGLVFVWYDRFERAPTYEIPVLDEVGDDEWTPWVHNILTIQTEPREVIENVADRQHFPRVHSTGIKEWENVFTDHVAVQRAEGIAYPGTDHEDNFKLEATYYGPAYQITRMDSFLPNILVNCHVPIDDKSIDLRFGVMLKKMADPAKMEKYSAGYIKNLQDGFREDVAIWENKKWRDRPILSDGDGPIGKLRRWYRQFYPQETQA